ERTGCKAYLLVTDGKSEFFRYSAMIRMKTRFPEIVGLFEAIHFLDDDRVAKVPADCEVISYCADTHYVARSSPAARAGRRSSSSRSTSPASTRRARSGPTST